MRSCIFVTCLVILFACIAETSATAEPRHSDYFTSGLSSFAHGKMYLTDLPPLDSNQQVPVQKAPEINYGRLALIGGVFTGAIATIHIYQQNGWWKDNRAPFHFQEDLVYGLSVDKIGHFYGATLLTFVFRNALESANVPEKRSLYIGAAGALLFQTYVEVEDGFSKWGFDRVDFASDVGGSLWPILQYEYPVLDNVALKFSYIPSDLVNNPGSPAFKGQKHTMIDDYEGQTLWLSAKVHNILPEPAAKYWPSFLCLAVGYGAKNIDAVRPPWPYSVVYLAIDYDFTKIVPDSTPLLKTIGKALNFVHFPAPAIRISPSTIWYGLFF
jgi:hypothetical protein